MSAERSTQITTGAGYPEHPKVVYLSGPYRSDIGENGVHCHIMEAEIIARRLWKLGLAVICPHKNTAYLGGTDIADDVWLTGDLAMLERCDAILMMPKWKQSKGATAEHDFARRRGLRIFYLLSCGNCLVSWAQRIGKCPSCGCEV